MSRDQKKLVMGSFAAALLIVPIIAHAATGVPQSSVTNFFKPSDTAIAQFSNNQTTAGRTIREAEYNGSGDILKPNSSTSDSFDDYTINDIRTASNQILRIAIVPSWYDPEKGEVVIDSPKINICYYSIQQDDVTSKWYLKGMNASDEPILSMLLADNWENDWTDVGDGTYLYRHEYDANKSTTKPFVKNANIELSDDDFRDYISSKGLELNIDILTDVIEEAGAAERGWF